MTTNKQEVKRYDCTSGGAQHCYGCYTMKECELGDYVEWEAYEALQAECEKLVEDLEKTELRALKFIHQCNAHVELYRELKDERDQLRAECEKLRKDAARLDWLADPNNNIGIVQLPTAIVHQNLHSLRDAIDSAMEPTK